MGRRWSCLLGALLVACGGRVTGPDHTGSEPGWQPGTRYPHGSLATYRPGGIGIAIYPPDATAETPPLTTLEGPWHEDACNSLAFDGAGSVYALCYQAVPAEPPGRVVVFASGATDTAMPSRVIAGPSTGITGYDTDVAVDRDGFVYVVRDDNGCDGAILVFAPDASGDAAPVRTLFGPHTELSCPASVALDAEKRLYVGNAEGSPILVFAPLADGDVPPIRRIGTRFDIGDALSVAVNDAGEVLVADAGHVKRVGVYAANATDADPPERTLAGVTSGIDSPGGVDFDQNGRLVVSSGHGYAPGTVSFFAKDADGDATPELVLPGSGEGIAIAP